MTNQQRYESFNYFTKVTEIVSIGCHEHLPEADTGSYSLKST